MANVCRCGHEMVHGMRYEAARTVDVRLCPSCWREDPPLYTEPDPFPSSDMARASWMMACVGCGRTFIATSRHPNQSYCTRTCHNWKRMSS